MPLDRVAAVAPKIVQLCFGLRAVGGIYADADGDPDMQVLLDQKIRRAHFGAYGASHGFNIFPVADLGQQNDGIGKTCAARKISMPSPPMRKLCRLGPRAMDLLKIKICDDEWCF
jgi:hypothetical protein